MLAKTREKIIRVLVTECEHAEIKAAAERMSLPVAVFVRSMALAQARETMGLPLRPAVPMSQAMKRRWQRALAPVTTKEPRS
jgi:hypothetical protein